MKNRLPAYLATVASSALFAASAFAAPLEKGAVVEAAEPTAQVGFEVFLPLRNTSGLESLLQAQHTPGTAQFHKWLTPAQFAAQFGPTAASMAKVQAELQGAGLHISGAHSRSFHVVGTAAQVSKLLQSDLNSVKSPAGSTRLVAAKNFTLPPAMSAAGAQVVAFNSVPAHRLTYKRSAAPLPDNRYGPEGPYWFDDLKQAYDYPSWLPNYHTGVSADGTGVNVAILMADLIFPNDVDSFFQHERWTTITHKPSPTVTTVPIDGGGVYNGYGSFEASLDVQQVTGGAPGANVSLLSLPDLQDSSIIDGLLYIVESNQYDIVNSSFGECELLYTAAYNGGSDYTYLLNIEHELYQQGNTQGITFVASSGDEGGNLCPNLDYFNHGPNPAFVLGVSSPASDPDVTGVGGGNLFTDQTPTSAHITTSHYVSENGLGDPELPQDPYGQGVALTNGYWGAGGGRSALYLRPPYQKSSVTGSASFRTVPDVGMQVGGCPYGLAITPCAPDSSVITAYGVGIGGGYYGVIGTSVSSPEFVGALALYEQTASRQGNLNYFLYSAGNAQTLAGGVNAPAAHHYFNRPATGYDGRWGTTYPSLNYNYIFGNGTPDVRRLFSLTAISPAGDPQTGSNP